MQTGFVLLSVPDRVRGGVMGILAACIGTQPLGTLTIGLLAVGLGTPPTFILNAVPALVGIVPLAIPLLRGEPQPSRRRAAPPGGVVTSSGAGRSGRPGCRPVRSPSRR